MGRALSIALWSFRKNARKRNKPGIVCAAPGGKVGCCENTFSQANLHLGPSPQAGQEWRSL